MASFVGDANIYKENDQVFAVRAENVLMNGEAECRLSAEVVEKSYAGGQLRILFRLEDGQMITANRYGIDADFMVGSNLMIGWKSEHAILMED